MKEILILGACRSGIGYFGGSLANVPAVDIAKTVTKDSLVRSKISRESVYEVIMGHVLQAQGYSQLFFLNYKKEI